MADNIQLNPGTLGDVLAADDVAGVKFQRVKVAHGADGSAVDAAVSTPLPVRDFGDGGVNLILSRYLDTNGDGTGTKNAVGNYSGGAQSFKLAPPASTIYRVHRLLVTIEDTSGMTPTEYGNLGAVLTNGITVRVHNGTSTVVDLTDGLPVKSNEQWGALCFDAVLRSWGAGNDVLAVRWTFSAAGVPLRLDGDASEVLELVLNDDFTGLVSHYFVAQGYTEGSLT